MRCKTVLIALVCGGLLPAPGIAQESRALRKIQETGIITVGFRDGSIPFSYLDKQQRPIGYSIDLCQRVVAAVRVKLGLPGLQVKFRPVTSANRFSFVANGIVDLECGSTSNTIERQKDVAFTLTIFVASGSLVSKKHSNIQALSDLDGKTVATTAGTTYLRALADANRSLGIDMTIVAGRDHADSFRLLESGRAQAFVMDDALLYGLAANARRPADYVIHNTDLSVEPYGIMVRKDDPQFKRVADEALAEVFRSGAIRQIYQKWFLSPIPPKNIVLQLPISAVLKRFIAAPTDSGNPLDYR
ncbi:amino acid ABC transporter substrate-binding protein [Janthinobacterium sp. CG_S6]|uniref:amino acid ABC transporter substrate-binding protein n=1 Tax=Janthinobacterium sp. CG_S6 TaxID=3071707 RepID=UPI002E055E3A|nr:glutamate/aspartate transport system substrate-binding protein [Janthinobacterium sp. CG_S6]